ncbi:MAG: hypothetical protein AAFO07_23505, partial [Bacteroidota bacterium]
MIVRMKEIWLFTLASSVDDTVYKLGELGVVDIQEIHPPSGEFIERRIEEVADIEKAVASIEIHCSKRENHTLDHQQVVLKDPKLLVSRILKACDLRIQCQEKLDVLLEQSSWYERWGKEINVQDLSFLKEHKIFVHLYQPTRKEVDSLDTGECIITFEEKNDRVPLAFITNDPSAKLDFNEEQTPDLLIQVIQQRIKRKKRQLKEIDDFLVEMTTKIDSLKDYLNVLKDQLEAHRVVSSMGDIEGTFKYLKGFMPKKSLDQLTAYADKNAWGYRILEPENPEEVPVYIKNPRWISIINPVLKFIDIVPGYKEMDVSIFFLIAFAVFVPKKEQPTEKPSHSLHL